MELQGQRAKLPEVRAAAPWLGLGAATAVFALALSAVGFPSPTLFAALVVGLAFALARPQAGLQPPGWSFVAAQAVVGVTLGAYMQSEALAAAAHDWLPVTLVSAATLGISMGAGRILARYTALDVPTATLGMIAGGASGIVTMAERPRRRRPPRRLHAVPARARRGAAHAAADRRLRRRRGRLGRARPKPRSATPQDWLLTAAIAAGAALVARRAARARGHAARARCWSRARLTLAGVEFAVPPALRELAFALIGLQVGLRFTLRHGQAARPADLPGPGRAVRAADRVRRARRPAHADDRRLASATPTWRPRPGGLYAVLAVAFGAGANTTFILAVQILRLLVAVLLAPLAVRRIARAGRPAG